MKKKIVEKIKGFHLECKIGNDMGISDSYHDKRNSSRDVAKDRI